MKRLILLTCLLMLIAFVSTCKKEPDLPGVSNRIEFGDSTIDTLSYRKITISSQLKTLGYDAITQHGHCWGTEPNPTISGNHSSLGPKSQVGFFKSQIENLNPNSPYYIRPYVTTQSQTIYGSQEKKTTLETGKPEVSTYSVFNVTAYSATCGGVVLTDSGLVVTSRGVCWDTQPNPTQEDHLGELVCVPGVGSFSGTITGLNRNQDYYFQAFAKNEKGVVYGGIQTFHTKCEAPEVETGWFYNISTSSLTMRDNRVKSEGGGTVSIRGVCWSHPNNPEPTYGNNEGFVIADAAGAGYYDIDVSGLLLSTSYIIRAFAINQDSIGYGLVKPFTTQGCPSDLTKNHIMGENGAPVTKTVTYSIVSINMNEITQCWITKNLGATYEATSTTDATESRAGWYWQFNKLQGYKHDGTTRTPSSVWISSIDDDSDWLAENDPCVQLLGSGWRLPTYAEWNNADLEGGWENYNDTYASVLKLHAAGILYDNSLLFRGLEGYYWSSSQDYNLYGKSLYFESSGCNMISEGKTSGSTVRCLMGQ
jgi:hypothetical protein